MYITTDKLNPIPLNIRDHFAIAALSALITRDQIAGEAELRHDMKKEEGFLPADEIPEDTRACWEIPESWHFVAQSAYAIADAMMFEREQPRDTGGM